MRKLAMLAVLAATATSPAFAKDKSWYVGSDEAALIGSADRAIVRSTFADREEASDQTLHSSAATKARNDDEKTQRSVDASAPVGPRPFAVLAFDARPTYMLSQTPALADAARPRT